jgi:predicted extracellular nuclease
MQKKFISFAILSALAAPSLHAASCDAEFTTVTAIQGQNAKSPLDGKTLTTRGVVQAVLYADSKQPMLLLGSLKNDADEKTAESILVTSSEMAALSKTGQVLQLTGTVREIQGMTALTNISKSAVCGAESIKAATKVQLPMQTSAQWEQYEGMLLSFPQTLVVNDSYTLARFGELLLADKRLLVATEVKQPGAEAAAFEQQQQLSEIIIDDGQQGQNVEPVRFPTGGLSANNSVRVGDSVKGVSGYLLQTKQGYRLVVNQDPTFVASNPRPAKPTSKNQDEFRVASFNVLNFFTGDGSAKPFPTKRGASNAIELSRQQAKMIAALSAMDADVIGLLEVENNGFDKGSALATLVTALNQQLGAEVYRAVQPTERPGSDDIMVAMIYRTRDVAEAGKAAVITKAPFDRGSRPPLAQSFVHKASGKTVTISINHFKSKGSCPKQTTVDSDVKDGQGCWTPTRVAAAKALTAWLNTNPTGTASDYRLIMGDLNAYRMELPLQQLEQDGWKHLAKASEIHTSYVFKGRSGSLDHALASPALHQQLTHFAHWHINADEPEVLDYNMEHKSKTQVDAWYQPTPFRSSDHDPLFMDFKF